MGRIVAVCVLFEPAGSKHEGLAELYREHGVRGVINAQAVPIQESVDDGRIVDYKIIRADRPAVGRTRVLTVVRYKTAIEFAGQSDSLLVRQRRDPTSGAEMIIPARQVVSHFAMAGTTGAVIGSSKRDNHLHRFAADGHPHGGIADGNGGRLATRVFDDVLGMR
jgi:hypothetical protein